MAAAVHEIQGLTLQAKRPHAADCGPVSLEVVFRYLQHVALMDAFDRQIEAHMAATGDDWDMAADFPPPDWVTHAEAKEYLEKELLPNAIHVP